MQSIKESQHCQETPLDLTAVEKKWSSVAILSSLALILWTRSHACFNDTPKLIPNEETRCRCLQAFLS